MSLQDQGTSSASTDLSLRRKRSRPRREEDAAVSPASDAAKRNKESVSVGNVSSDHDMLGCVITGVIEGSFDAGYFLNVRSVDTGTHLRGAVFIPGRFTPVTAANDIAPSAKMYQREEMLVPSSVSVPRNKASACDQSSMQKSSEKPVEHRESIAMEDEVDKKDLESVAGLTNEPVRTVEELCNTLQTKKTGNAEPHSKVELKERIAMEVEVKTLPSKKTIDVAWLTNESVGTLRNQETGNIESQVEEHQGTGLQPKPAEHQQTADNGGERKEVQAPNEKEACLQQGMCKDTRLGTSTGTVTENEQSQRDGRAAETGSCSTLVVFAAEINVPTLSDPKLVLEESAVPVQLEAHNSAAGITNNVREDAVSAEQT